MDINNKIDNNIQNQDILNIKEGNENKERDEQNNYIEIENQGEEEQEKNILNSNNIDIKEITENKDAMLVKLYDIQKKKIKMLKEIENYVKNNNVDKNKMLNKINEIKEEYDK